MARNINSLKIVVKNRNTLTSDTFARGTHCVRLVGALPCVAPRPYVPTIIGTHVANYIAKCRNTHVCFVNNNEIIMHE